jgi:hypothetical protein
MPMHQTGALLAIPETREALRRNALIESHVMHELGQPNGLHSVEVRALWAHNFRANIRIGSDAVSAKVAHSYFVVTDGDGKVLASTPAIIEQY